MTSDSVQRKRAKKVANQCLMPFSLLSPDSKERRNSTQNVHPAVRTKPTVPKPCKKGRRQLLMRLSFCIQHMQFRGGEGNR